MPKGSGKGLALQAHVRRGGLYAAAVVGDGDGVRARTKSADRTRIRLVVPQITKGLYAAGDGQGNGAVGGAHAGLRRDADLHLKGSLGYIDADARNVGAAIGIRRGDAVRTALIQYDLRGAAAGAPQELIAARGRERDALPRAGFRIAGNDRIRGGLHAEGRGGRASAAVCASHRYGVRSGRAGADRLAGRAGTPQVRGARRGAQRRGFIGAYFCVAGNLYRRPGIYRHCGGGRAGASVGVRDGHGVGAGGGDGDGLSLCPGAPGIA